jgi:LacI family transcriptional regulator, repressor for deo operon, udp, cdd, tsx, nupC, and nupG
MANIKDIAELAGVSIATVSRALRTPAIVRPETVKKIDAAIEKLNYTPNMLASGLRRQRSQNIVVAIPSIFNPFTSAFVQGIENVAREAGYRLLLGITESDQSLLDSYADMISGKQADGLILLDTILPAIVTRYIDGMAAAPPVVVACEYAPSLTLPRVRFDNVEAVAMAVAHLARNGHRRIATISGPAEQQMARERLAGFKLGMRRAQIEVDEALILPGDFSLKSGHRAMSDLIASGIEFTGVCCANDEMALGALSALQEAGIEVPGQVSVVGFDNLRFAAYSRPPLTTIDVPTLETGETAMRLMLDLLRDPEDAMREVTLPHRLITRGSSGPAPR